jgi:hypothetical protein
MNQHFHLSLSAFSSSWFSSFQKDQEQQARFVAALGIEISTFF